MFALIYFLSWVGLWITLILGFFLPGFWLWTFICLVGIILSTSIVNKPETYTRELTLRQSAIRGLSPMAIVLCAVLLLKVCV